MLTLTPSVTIYVCLQPADMRKSLDGLSELARAQAGQDPMSGHLFLFRNRRGDRLKVLYWDRNGFALWYKRLERGTFSFPDPRAGTITISENVFQQLLGGLRLDRVWKVTLEPQIYIDSASK